MDVAEPVPALTREHTVRLIEGQRGLSAGLVAVLGLAAATVLDRVLTVPFLYASRFDLVLHLSAELVAGSVLWVLAWSFLAVGLWLTRAIPPRGKQQKVARATLAGLFGTALGLVACDVVPRHSAYWSAAPPAVWWTGSIAAGAALSFGVYLALARPVPPRARFIGAAVSLFALGLHLWSLHHELQRYGNLLALVQCASPVVLGVGATLFLPDSRPLSGAGRAAAVVGALCLLCLGFSEPSYSARRAVLVLGATAKQLVLRALWPVADHDGDGAPRRFWGRDPDDANPEATPFSSPKRAARAVPVSLGAGNGAAPVRNLLWIIVDTVRTDSFERIVANDSVVRSRFAEFAGYANYSSCSSRTYLVLAQLLDAFRCDPRELDGPAYGSLLAMLRSRGFYDEIYSYYAPTVPFARAVTVRDDQKLFEAAARALSEPTAGPRALFVHFKGGHGEYVAPGATPRERYENQLRRSLAAVGELAARAPAERWAVVVLGDHGEAFGEHDSMAHATTLYEEVLRTPLLVRAPNVSPGTTAERLGCSDVAWRALHAVGVLKEPVSALPYQFALLDLSRAEGGRAQRDSIRALRRGSLKVLWRPQLGVWELYDLDHDPAELHSLTETRTREFSELRSELQRLSSECSVPAASATSGSSSSTL